MRKEAVCVAHLGVFSLLRPRLFPSFSYHLKYVFHLYLSELQLSFYLYLLHFWDFSSSSASDDLISLKSKLILYDKGREPMTSSISLQAICLSKYMLFHSRLLSWACKPSEPLPSHPPPGTQRVLLCVPGGGCTLQAELLRLLCLPFPAGLVGWEVGIRESGEPQALAQSISLLGGPTTAQQVHQAPCFYQVTLDLGPLPYLPSA